MTNQSLSDRELLEYAAKAASLEVADPAMSAIFVERWPLQAEGLHIRLIHDEYLYWNPLTSDADAFRLMVGLALDVSPSDEHDPNAIVTDFSELGIRVKEARRDGDHLTNTRRAIVRAAAEIGRAK